MPYSTIRNTQTQLKDVQRLLKLDPSNTELLSQKQRLLKDAIGETKEKLETLKTAQEQAKKQLEEGTLGGSCCGFGYGFVPKVAIFWRDGKVLPKAPLYIVAR